MRFPALILRFPAKLAREAPNLNMPKVKINVAAEENEDSQKEEAKKETKKISRPRRSRVSKVSKTKSTSSSNRINKTSSRIRTNKRKTVSRQKITVLDEDRADKESQPEKKSINRTKVNVGRKIKISAEEIGENDLKPESSAKKSKKIPKASKNNQLAG